MSPISEELFDAANVLPGHARASCCMYWAGTVIPLSFSFVILATAWVRRLKVLLFLFSFPDNCIFVLQSGQRGIQKKGTRQYAGEITVLASDSFSRNTFGRRDCFFCCLESKKVSYIQTQTVLFLYSTPRNCLIKAETQKSSKANSQAHFIFYALDGKYNYQNGLVSLLI